jgi:hypothetical protein
MMLTVAEVQALLARCGWDGEWPIGSNWKEALAVVCRQVLVQAQTIKDLTETRMAPPESHLLLPAGQEVEHLRSEVERLCGLLTRCWDAAGLLHADVTGRPGQAWDEPSDLVAAIESLAERAAAAAEEP